MNNKEMNPAVAMAIGAVVLVIILALGYKLFLAPPPEPPRQTMFQYPGGSYPGGPSAAPAKP